jgi:hypothetical protein
MLCSNLLELIVSWLIAYTKAHEFCSWTFLVIGQDSPLVFEFFLTRLPGLTQTRAGISPFLSSVPQI